MKTNWQKDGCRNCIHQFTCLRATARMAVSTAGSKFPAIVDLPHTSIPRPILRLFLLLRWAVHWPCLTAGTWQDWACSVEPFYYKLLPWSWLKWHWHADWLQWRSLLVHVLIFPPFQWGNEYWIAAAQWMTVIDAGAVPCTPSPHTPHCARRIASRRRTACIILSAQCTSVITRHSV